MSLEILKTLAIQMINGISPFGIRVKNRGEIDNNEADGEEIAKKIINGEIQIENVQNTENEAEGVSVIVEENPYEEFDEDNYYDEDIYGELFEEEEFDEKDVLNALQKVDEEEGIEIEFNDESNEKEDETSDEVAEVNDIAEEESETELKGKEALAVIEQTIEENKNVADVDEVNEVNGIADEEDTEKEGIEIEFNDESNEKEDETSDEVDEVNGIAEEEEDPEININNIYAMAEESKIKNKSTEEIIDKIIPEKLKEEKKKMELYFEEDEFL